MGLGFLDCNECQDTDEQQDRGCHRFGLKLKARRPWAVDYTGNKAHDQINFCPRSCSDPENQPPGRVSLEALAAGLAKFRKIKACGGLSDFNGLSPSDCPPRVSWFYATVEGIISRYQAEVRDTQTQLQNAVVSTLTRPRTTDDG